MDLTQIVVIHIAGNISNNMGGPPRVISGIVNSLKNNDFLINYLICVKENKAGENLNLPEINKKYIFFLNNTIFSFNEIWITIKHVLNRHNKSKVIIHCHGLWYPLANLACFIAQIKGIPYIISTHGMLSKNALKKKFFKKYLALLAYQKKNLLKASAIHATSLIEKNDISLIIPNTRISIIPNGFDGFKGNEIRHPNLNFSTSLRTFLFIGRIHPIKGIDLLIEAWAKAKPKQSNLLISGYIADKNYFDMITEKINSLNLNNDIKFIGESNEGQIKYLLQESTFFILPSLSENFGVVVLESLWYGLPVITTKQTPWEQLNLNKSGWCIDRTLDSFIDIIRRCDSITTDEIMNMSDNAKIFARAFDWKIISKNFVKMYRKILNQ